MDLDIQRQLDTQHSIVVKKTLNLIEGGFLCIHGIVLFIPCPTPSNPNRGINCKFEDFEWLRQNQEPDQNCFANLAPALSTNKRIQVWVQGNQGYPRDNFRTPQEALKKLNELLSKYGKTYQDIQIFWSHPKNQSPWQQK